MGGARAARPQAQLGPVEPRWAAPPLVLTLHTGERQALSALLQGQVCALQLMFTGCSALCPLQGAIFAALQRQLDAELPSARLLSVSIDPLGDDAAALARWRQRFQAGARWLAGVPSVAQADRLPDFLGSRAFASSGPAPGADRHSAQTYVFDAQGRLAHRCADLASAAEIAAAMRLLARLG